MLACVADNVGTLGEFEADEEASPTDSRAAHMGRAQEAVESRTGADQFDSSNGSAL